MAEEKKSWWQTAAGLMTGAAALITAITGVFVAAHQMRKDSEDDKHPTTEQPARTGDSLSRDNSKGVGRSSLPPSKTGPQGGQQRIVTPPTDRAAYAVALPARHEFVLGVGLLTGRFTVTSARLEPHTDESDTLKVSVQVLVDGQQPYPFNNMQFELRIDEKPYRSTTYFNERIPVGEA